VTNSSTPTIAAAMMVAEPCSLRRLHCRDADGADTQRRQQIRPGGDRRDNKPAVAAQLHHGAAGRDAARGVDRRTLVATCAQPRRLAGRVDATDLHRHRREARQTQHQHRDQRDDAQRRLDGARTRIADYVLVLSARAMMLVNAETIESPVTTV
jgi:hypothetical protein